MVIQEIISRKNVEDFNVNTASLSQEFPTFNLGCFQIIRRVPSLNNQHPCHRSPQVALYGSSLSRSARVHGVRFVQVFAASASTHHLHDRPDRERLNERDQITFLVGLSRHIALHRGGSYRFILQLLLD